MNGTEYIKNLSVVAERLSKDQIVDIVEQAINTYKRVRDNNASKEEIDHCYNTICDQSLLLEIKRHIGHIDDVLIDIELTNKMKKLTHPGQQ